MLRATGCKSLLLKHKISITVTVNSVVFGGNFLHSLNIQLQLKIYELEGRLKDPPKYRFPSFEVVNWLAAGKLRKDLADLNSDNTACPENLLNGIRSLVTALRNWLNGISQILISICSFSDLSTVFRC